jgi:hypothetical protein
MRRHSGHDQHQLPAEWLESEHIAAAILRSCGRGLRTVLQRCCTAGVPPVGSVKGQGPAWRRVNGDLGISGERKDCKLSTSGSRRTRGLSPQRSCNDFNLSPTRSRCSGESNPIGLSSVVMVAANGSGLNESLDSNVSGKHEDRHQIPLYRQRGSSRSRSPERSSRFSDDTSILRREEDASMLNSAIEKCSDHRDGGSHQSSSSSELLPLKSSFGVLMPTVSQATLVHHDRSASQDIIGSVVCHTAMHESILMRQQP